MNIYGIIYERLGDMGLELRWLERTPDKGEVVGSSPFRPTMISLDAYYNGVLAQLGEHLPCTQGVKGSSPLFSTICNYLYAGWQQGNCNCTLKTE